MQALEKKEEERKISDSKITYFLLKWKCGGKNNMEYEIIGGSFPIVECTLKSGEAMITQSGSMAWMDPTIKMETSTNGGIGKVVGRLFTKEALFQNIYTSEKDGSKIAFGTAVPGSIRAIKIEPGKTVICQK